MDVLSKDQVSYALQAFVLFLNISKGVRSIDQSLVEECRQAALDLMEKLLLDKQDSASCCAEFNELIAKINHSLTVPYPTLVNGTSETFIKTEILAFEHYLKQELQANHLSVQDEAPLFNDSVKLWEKIGASLSAKEGTIEFSGLIKKLNQIVPKEERYPLPDENQN